MSPAVGPPGSTTTITGSGFAQYEAIDVYFDTTDVRLQAADANGNFSGLALVIPTSAQPGTHWITLVGRHSGDAAQKSFRVATDWTEFQSNSRNTGYNALENTIAPSNVDTLELNWSVTVPGYLDRSPPIVVSSLGKNGTIFTTSSGGSNHKLYAFDAKTGTELWDSGQNLTSNSPASPAYSASSKLVYVNDGLRIDAFPSTCHTPCGPAWVSDPMNGSGIAAFVESPTVSGGMVYVNNGDISGSAASIVAFPASCTNPCPASWTGTSSNPYPFGPASSWNGTVFDNQAHDLEARRAGDGGEIWSQDTSNFLSVTTPVVADGRIFVGTQSADGFNTLGLSRFDARGCPTTVCGPNWSTAVGSDFSGQQNFPTPAVARGVVYYTPGNDTFAAINGTTGAIKWTAPMTGASDESTAVVANGVVYLHTGNDLTAYPSTCSTPCAPLWTAGVTNNGFASSPIVVNGTVYETSGDGSLQAYTLNGVTPNGAARPNPRSLRPDRGLVLRSRAT
jgi:outer membrane protein assembly factor BamB